MSSPGSISWFCVTMSDEAISLSVSAPGRARVAGGHTVDLDHAGLLRRRGTFRLRRPVHIHGPAARKLGHPSRSRRRRGPAERADAAGTVRRRPGHHGSQGVKWPVLLAARRHARQLVAQETGRCRAFSPRSALKLATGTFARGLSVPPAQHTEVRAASCMVSRHFGHESGRTGLRRSPRIAAR